MQDDRMIPESKAKMMRAIFMVFPNDSKRTYNNDDLADVTPNDESVSFTLKKR